MKKQFMVAGMMVVLLVVGLSGCFEQTSTDTVSAAQITANMLKSFADAKSYSYNTNGSIIINEAYAGPINGYGEVDIANKRLMMAQTVFMGESTIEIYVIDNIEYTNTTGSQGISDLQKKNITNEIWTQYDSLGSQMDLLEISYIERLDDEMVNGVDCYVVKVIPDTEKYYDMIMNQTVGNHTWPDVPQNYQIKDMEATLWIAKDTNYTVKSYNQMTLLFTIYDYGSMLYSMETENLYSDYNTGFSIELPAWAQNASWVT